MSWRKSVIVNSKHEQQFPPRGGTSIRRRLLRTTSRGVCLIIAIWVVVATTITTTVVGYGSSATTSCDTAVPTDRIIYYSTWAELAQAIQTTRILLNPNCTTVQVTFRIQPNSILDATEVITTLPPIATSTPTTSSTTNSPTVSPTTTPIPTAVPTTFLLSSSSSSHSYDYGSSRRAVLRTRRRQTRNTSSSKRNNVVAVDIDAIIEDVERASLLPHNSSKTNYNTTPTKGQQTSASTMPTSAPNMYNDDMITRTAITIDPYQMITLLPNSTDEDYGYYNDTNISSSSYSSSEQISIHIMVQCGDDGNIQNNCIITGGDTHFLLDVTLPPSNTNKNNTILLLLQFNTQTTIRFRGMIMQHAKDTSVLLYHSSGYIFGLRPESNPITNSTSIDIRTLHKVNVLFQDCYWRQNAGNYGAVIDIYKEESNSQNVQNYTSKMAASFYQLNVKFQRCIFDNNFSEKGSAIFIENSDTTNTLLAVTDSLFLNNAQSGAIRSTYATTTAANESLYMADQLVSQNQNFNIGIYLKRSCFIGNINSIGQGTVYVEYPQFQSENFVVTSRDNYGENNMVGSVEYYNGNFSSSGSCTGLFIQTIPWKNENSSIIFEREECFSFDASKGTESCQLLDSLLPLEPSLAPTPKPNNLIMLCPDGSSKGFSSWVTLTTSIESSPGNEVFTLCPNTGTFLALIHSLRSLTSIQLIS